MRIRDGDWTLRSDLSDIKLGRYVWEMQNPDGTTTHRTDYMVDATVGINKAQRNLSQDHWKGDMHHVASIPLNVYYDQLAAAEQQKDDRYLSKWLNDSDNLAWRTKGGRV